MLPVPQKPRVVETGARLRLAVHFHEPNDAPRQHDLLGELRAVGEQVGAPLGMVEVAAQQHGHEPLDRRRQLQRMRAELLGLLIGRVGYDAAHRSVEQALELQKIDAFGYVRCQNPELILEHCHHLTGPGCGLQNRARAGGNEAKQGLRHPSRGLVKIAFFSDIATIPLRHVADLLLPRVLLQIADVLPPSKPDRRLGIGAHKFRCCVLHGQALL